MDLNFEHTLAQNQHHFHKLDTIIQENPEKGYVFEGNIFYEMSGLPVSSRFYHKRYNLFALARKSKYIMEIGFNAGHSCLLMLIANPSCKIQCFDIGWHPYTQPCFEYLRSCFPERIEIVYGDSTKTVATFHQEHPGTKFDLLHIDGGHDEDILVADLFNTRMLADRGEHIVIIDDDNIPHIHALNRLWLKNGVLSPYEHMGELMSLDDGSMDHFIARYNFTPLTRHLMVARYKGELSWVHNDDTYDIIIYNKGEPIYPPSFACNIRDVPNVGMDQASHLQYIVDNYDRLPNIVLFTQDDLDVHIREDINIYCSNKPEGDTNYYIKKMFEEAEKYGASQNAFTYSMFGSFSPSYTFKLPRNYDHEHFVEETFGEWFEKYVGKYPSGKFLWFKNAIFAVQRKYILQRPREEYVRILGQFKHARSELNHFMERAWYYLLCLDTQRHELKHTATSVQTQVPSSNKIAMFVANTL